MKLLHTKNLKDGRKHLLIELAVNERAPVPPINDGAFYQLSYPMDDTIIEGFILNNPQRVTWDSYSQKWIDV